jgi:hypothetical protein
MPRPPASGFQSGAKQRMGLKEDRPAAEGLVLETFSVERIEDFYEEATRGRSASHHLEARYTHVDSQRLRTVVGNLRLHS